VNVSWFVDDEYATLDAVPEPQPETRVTAGAATMPSPNAPMVMVTVDEAARAEAVVKPIVSVAAEPEIVLLVVAPTVDTPPIVSGTAAVT
jgi:hypothetical protein